MIGIPFLTDLFANVLQKSRGIEGRFYVCPNMGKEINADDLDQVITEAFSKPKENKTNPISILMPPVISGSFKDKSSEWSTYRLIMFFLKTSYYTGTNQIMAPNQATGTSTHTIPQDWHDMQRCAINFLKVLDHIQRKKGLVRDRFRIDTAPDAVIRPVSNLGVNRMAGVRVDYHVQLYTDCPVEDYGQSDIDNITVPGADSHPEHTL